MTGWPVLALLPRIEPNIKPGSPGMAMPGYDAKIVDSNTGHTLPANEKGILAFGLPLPPGCMQTVWRNDELFSNHYCGQFSDAHLYSTFDYVVAKQDLSDPEIQSRLRKEIESVVVSQLGAFSRPAAIHIIRALPKTRSGKILRRAILAAAEGKETGDLSTLEDPVALEAIREIIRQRTA